MVHPFTRLSVYLSVALSVCVTAATSLSTRTGSSILFVLSRILRPGRLSRLVAGLLAR